MFRHLRIQNFRSIHDSGDLNLSQLNLFVGPNNSGKSSILATLLMLKQSFEDKDPTTGLITSGPMIDLGSYFDIVTDKPDTTPLSLCVQLDPQVMETSFPFRFQARKGEKDFLFDKFQFVFRYDRKRNDVTIQSFVITATNTGQTISGKESGDKWTISGLPEGMMPHLTAKFMHFLPTFVPGGPQPKNQDLAQQIIGFSLQWTSRVQSFAQAFSRIFYVGPVRERIPRYGVLGTMPFCEIGPSGQNLMRVLSAPFTSVGSKSRKTALQALNEWFENRFKLLRHLRIRKLDKGGTIRALIADDLAGGRSINLASTGSGISQIVPVVVQAVLTQRNGCLIVEQPEVHLHPAAQTALADLFLEQMREGKQFIIETHSEHLVLRIRRRIAEGRVKPESVRIFFVEKVSGMTQIRELQLEESGHFKDWPEGFFEEGYEEAMALARASAKKGKNPDGPHN